MENDTSILNKILAITQELIQIQDLDLLLERVLTEVRNLAHADAGSIYIVEESKLKFSHTQNITLQKKLSPGKKLVYSTFTIPINNKSMAGYVANTGEILNIADAYKIDRKNPYSFDKSFDEASGYHTQSVLSVPIKTSRAKIIGVIQLINALDNEGKTVPFDPTNEPILQHFALSVSAAIEHAKMLRSIILRMIKMAELRDPEETGQHVNRVAAYSIEIYEAWARKKNIPEEDIQAACDILRMAAMLHDVGKVAIPDAILKKPGLLDPNERAIMEKHTELGATLFPDDQESAFDIAASAVALNHHEKWDGTGYPGHIVIDDSKNPQSSHIVGKKGEEIPIFGRIVALADVYDALSRHRVYKEAWPEEKVIATLKKDAGTHFDPEVVDAFLERLDVIRAINKSYAE